MRAKAELPIAAADAAMIERHISRVRPAETARRGTRDLRTGAGWTVDEALRARQNPSAHPVPLTCLPAVGCLRSGGGRAL